MYLGLPDARSVSSDFGQETFLYKKRLSRQNSSLDIMAYSRLSRCWCLSAITPPSSTCHVKAYQRLANLLTTSQQTMDPIVYRMMRHLMVSGRAGWSCQRGFRGDSVVVVHPSHFALPLLVMLLGHWEVMTLVPQASAQRQKIASRRLRTGLSPSCLCRRGHIGSLVGWL